MINDTIQQRLQTPAPAAPQAPATPDMGAFQQIASTNETDPAQTVQEVNELARTTEAAFVAMSKIIDQALNRIAALEQNKMR